MILNFLIATLVIFGLLTGWVIVQQAARRFSARHPELGPAREEGGGCGGIFCRCDFGGKCPKEDLTANLKKN